MVKTGWCPQHGYPLPCYKCGYPIQPKTKQDIKQETLRRVGKLFRRNKWKVMEPAFMGGNQHVQPDPIEAFERGETPEGKIPDETGKPKTKPLTGSTSMNEEFHFSGE